MMFSIIIPIFNCENYIRRCVDSVLKQTYDKWELILVDDGSTDKSALLCDEYKRKDRRIVVYHQSNSGASAARNKGIQKATREYTIFLDSDDYWMDINYLKKINERLKRFESDVLSVNFCKIYSDGKVIPYYSCNDMPIFTKTIDSLDFMKQNAIWISAAWNKIIRTNLIKENNLYFKIGVSSEDIEWSARLALIAKSFDYLNVMGVAYVQRDDSVSHSMTQNKLMDLKENILRVEQIVLGANDEKKKILETYFAFQIGILLFDIALMNDRKFSDTIKENIIHLKKYLAYSKQKQIRLIRFCWNLLGYDGMIFVMKTIVKT